LTGFDSPAPAATRRARAPCAFYSVSDSRFFPGVVALLNSLRLLGHGEPFFVVDAGLTEEQRDRLAPHAVLVPAPRDEPAVFLAPLGPLEHPAGVAVLLDADIVVTRPLTELVEAAREGRVVSFADEEPPDDRSFPEWRSVLGLGPLRRQVYVNAGQLFVPDSIAERLLPRWMDAQAMIDRAQTRYGRARLSDPFYFADQDVLNALLASIVRPEELAILEHRLAPHPPFAGLRLVESERLLCSYPDGTRPFFLHHILPKPWLKATRTTVYARLLPRLLLAPDVALRLEPDELPLRLRESRLAAVDRGRANAQALLVANARRQLGRFGVRTRVAAWRRRGATARP
jgi:hypothetical protein